MTASDDNKKRKRRPFSRPRKGGDAPSPGAVADVSAQELARRSRQRELRLAALAARAEGKEYKKGQGRKGKSPSRPKGPDVVIIPILWRERPREARSILTECERLKTGVHLAGLKCEVDSSNEDMPGTKFRRWEQRGVRVRIECGPKDLLEGMCTVAVTRVRGELAEKTRVKSERAADVAAAAVRGEAPPPAAQGRAPSAPSAPSTHAARPSVVPMAKPKHIKFTSGDDLGEDFELGNGEDNDAS